MCRNCEDGMATECWDAGLPTKLPDVSFDLTSYIVTADPNLYFIGERKTGMAVNREQAEISRAFREALKLDSVQAEVNRRMGIMADFGDDTWTEGTVFRFSRTFENSLTGKAYAYAALKCTDGKWYVTGKDGAGLGGMSWRSFLAWLVGHATASIVAPSDIFVANQWATLNRWKVDR